MKRLILMVMLSQIFFITEAKQKNVVEGVDVYSIHSSIYNGSEFRSESISADICKTKMGKDMSNMIRIMHIFTNGNNKFIRRPLSRSREAIIELKIILIKE